VGEVDDDQKGDLLRGAIALLNPVEWPEPFGLVMAEALACGTPVVATCRGAVPEVVDDGQTGFVCDTDDEMVQACHAAGGLSRPACRARAERYFSPAVMASGYERVYHRILAEGRRPRAA
jgi:glycosyltransferase involved in cell wall biosynthesis